MIIVEPKVEVENFNGIELMKKIERAGKTCYRFESNITEDSYKQFIKNLIARGHESVLEHEKVTVRLTCDTGVVKDLTRHRLTSFSIESTRYCNYNNDRFGSELRFVKPLFVEDDFKYGVWYECMAQIEQDYRCMANAGAQPDEMRMLLPHSTAAEVVITANMREWRHILQLRAAKTAHSAVRQLMIPLLLYFQTKMPELFEDIEYDILFPIDKYARIINFDNN